MSKEQIRFVQRYLFYLRALGWSNPKKNVASGCST